MVGLKLGLFATKKIFGSKYLALCILFSVFAFVILMATSRSTTVCIIDNGNIDYVYTTIPTNEESKDAILEAGGIELGEHDEAAFNSPEGSNYAEIFISRAFPVTILADGNTTALYVRGGTVADVLEKTKIDLNERDIISLDPSRLLEANDQIVINRVDIRKTVLEEAIPYETEIREDRRVLENMVTVLDEGVEGKRETTIMGTYVDGRLDEYSTIKEEVVQEPVNEIKLKGNFPVVSDVKPFDFQGVEYDETGRPTNALYILDNQVATAYSARAGAKTASGRFAVVGTVAVDPKVIPYGTHLYIETVTGNYAYGYAVAADTGIALLDGRVDVDLFFGSYAESVWWGRRMVNIYILPTPGVNS
jgi:3D (Asp-Asp-Asp) domain-containing protein